jgi:hypothetical protein
MKKDYDDLLKSQRSSADAKSIHDYLFYLYSHFQVNLNASEHSLEVGAGAGTSSLFLMQGNILRTDYLEIESSNVMGGVDVHDLPFKDSEFYFTFGMDILHHLNDPFTALKEISRVIKIEKPRDIIVFIEPYVSVFSYLIYKLFHSESTSLYSQRKLVPPLVSSRPEDGDQMLPRLIFLTPTGRDKISRIFPDTDFKVEVKFISVLSFFLTGGINRPLPTPKSVIKVLIKLEEKIPQQAMKFLASRMVITISKV